MQNRKALVIIVLSVLVLFIFLNPFFFSRLAPAIDDLATKLSYQLNKKPNQHYSKIVLVGIDEKSIRLISSRWPWPRSLYAKAVYILGQQKAKVIGFDIAFIGDGASAYDDQVFSDMLANSPSPVVLAYFLDKDANISYPKKIFTKKALAGFINSPADSDGVIRGLRGRFKSGGIVDYSWAVKISGLYLNQQPDIRNYQIVLGERTIPTSKQGIFSIKYALAPDQVNTISFYDLIKRNFSEDFFKDKIVLIGPTALSMHDVHPTPLGQMPGIFIHVNGIYNILENRLIAPVPAIVSLIILILLIVGLTVFVTSFSFLRGFFLALGLFLGLIWLDIGLRAIGLDLPSGKIIVPAGIYLLVVYAYTYVNFLSLIVQVKNQMTKDPLSGLHTLRYFQERLHIDLRAIPRRIKYLIVIVLEDFDFLTKGESFAGLKIIWEEISGCLRGVSRRWTRFSDDVVVGASQHKDDAEKLGKLLSGVLSRINSKIKVKVGVALIKPDLEFSEVLPYLTDIIRKNQESTVVFPANFLDGFSHKKNKSERIVSSLFLDVEEKNKELLTTIARLKEEEKKTKEAFLELVTSLVNALESKDNYTKGHTQRVCDYALILAHRLRLSEEEKERIRKAALLHDLGKIGIPDTILHKPGKLSDAEFIVIKQHPVMAANILKPISEFSDVIPYALHHHERYDGNGYPQGLKADDIPLGARIIAIADVYDAMTTGRDYKPAFSIQDTLKEMISLKGKQFDPVLIDEFIEALKTEGIYKP